MELSLLADLRVFVLMSILKETICDLAYFWIQKIQKNKEKNNVTNYHFRFFAKSFKIIE